MNASLLLQQTVDHEQVAGSLHARVAQPAQAVERFLVATFANKPPEMVSLGQQTISWGALQCNLPWTFGAKEHLGHDDERRHTGRTQHEAPVETGNVGRVADFVEDERGGCTCSDAESRPDLPLHDQCTADL